MRSVSELNLERVTKLFSSTKNIKVFIIALTRHIVGTKSYLVSTDGNISTSAIVCSFNLHSRQLLTVVSPAYSCFKNWGSSNSLIAGILSDSGTSGSTKSVEWSDTSGNMLALADARIKRRIGSGVIVASAGSLLREIQRARTVLCAIFFPNVQRIYTHGFTYLLKISHWSVCYFMRSYRMLSTVIHLS